MMASSAHKQQRQLHLPNICVGGGAAPPPTPSNNHPSTSASPAADALSRLLHSLPSPTLSLPNTRTRSPSATRPPLISLSNPNRNEQILSSASQLGFFQLTNHGISSQLAHSAELEALSLFELERDKKLSCFPKNWPLGYEAEEEEDEEGNGESFCLDSACYSDSNELNLTSLREFTRAMEKVGLKIFEMLAAALGFQNPLGDDPTRYCSLLWMSKNLHGNKPVLSGGFYPYIVGLHYQIRPSKHTLIADAGSVPISAEVDSILVTLGDIAQVWTNGKTKKVRSGRPMGGVGDEKSKSDDSISMILLVTLPIDSVVFPLIPKLDISNNNHGDDAENTEDDNNNSEGQGQSHDDEEGRKLFESFSFEDYAWRVYHERLLFKDDPLDRYRI
ncbi:2-oxoglutarate (2OG) and Fe(II)-dependent oxygenase superfamily protein [Citrus sinensis]|uniref:Non-haem dioxygenase N-terminal domain-containing protein n=1 Tax=Citrus clementina TaxID=85681 RepID=V4TGZ3_CITCL|nr:gibberellin 2-beta-dioxygenase 2 [Citrus x clementina]XP_006486306.1 gibberellin 2-beta-dioxygenase 2 [Citrus sinensis]ESR48996.1 hypothetical protein CICLE_v10031789mg [Citrus x clementina]KAH9702546.1 2-oxoglutarate (2OG) and Fe(II)-dependent oxygenase superfamily protein [Citrus sinensis]GAY40440.1 hypothetical protein CUMW_051950 [Citrus unshiu]